MLTDLTSLMLMLCLNICLDDSLSDRVDLNTDWNSLIMTHNYLFITANSLTSDFSEFYWITNKYLTVLCF